MSDDRLPRYRYVPDHPCNFHRQLHHGFAMIQADGAEGTAAALAHLHRAVDWCKEQFGDNSFYRDPKARWVAMGSHIWFREQDDAFAFKMRWC